MSIKVKIENFQSIKDIEFEIDKYTVLTGPSNSGKSAICRAIEGALFNRSGDGFVRSGEKHAQVTFTTDTHEIVWTKGSGKNHYTINGEVYDKVGSDVPELIHSMGFRDIELSRSKIRPQMGTDQFDVLFLIREQGSLISEVFSVLGRLDVITKAGKECGTDLKSRKSLLKTRYEDLSAVDKKLNSYQGFEKVELAADSLQADYDEISEAQVELKLLQELNFGLQSSTKHIIALEAVRGVFVPEELELKEINQLKGLRAANITLGKLDTEIINLSSVLDLSVPEFSEEKLLNLVGQLKSVNLNYTKLKKDIEVLQPLEDFVLPLEPSLEDLKELDVLIESKNKSSELNIDIDNESSSLYNLSQQIADLEMHLKDLVDGLEECPLCNQALARDYVH